MKSMLADIKLIAWTVAMDVPGTCSEKISENYTNF